MQTTKTIFAFFQHIIISWTKDSTGVTKRWQVLHHHYNIPRSTPLPSPTVVLRLLLPVLRLHGAARRTGLSHAVLSTPPSRSSLLISRSTRNPRVQNRHSFSYHLLPLILNLARSNVSFRFDYYLFLLSVSRLICFWVFRCVLLEPMYVFVYEELHIYFHFSF